MKLVMDERVKHRLVGVVVILSVAIIFLPALFKKSNRHFEDNVNLAVQLPAKPMLPEVAVVNEKVLFQSVKVAKVDLPPLEDTVRKTALSRAEPIRSISVVPSAPIHTDVAVAEVAPKKIMVHAPPRAKAVALKKGGYGVQLASFSAQKNAELLVARLSQRGYKASYNKISGKQGAVYKVIVGQLSQKEAAAHLQKQLVLSMQLNGFVVKVS